jgi:hypothetical protein
MCQKKPRGTAALRMLMAALGRKRTLTAARCFGPIWWIGAASTDNQAADLRDRTTGSVQ